MDSAKLREFAAPYYEKKDIFIKGDIKKDSSVVAEIENNKIVYKCKVL